MPLDGTNQEKRFRYSKTAEYRKLLAEHEVLLANLGILSANPTEMYREMVLAAQAKAKAREELEATRGLCSHTNTMVANGETFCAECSVQIS